MPIGRSVLQKPGYSAGQRNRLVTIQAGTPGTGTSGMPIITWEPLEDVWMSRMDISAEEHFVANQDSAFGQARWNMPYREDMDPEIVDVPATRRLVYQGRAYDIESASPIGWKLAIEVITLAPSKVPS